MVNPTGYTALDMIGFTDQGAYSSSDNYVKNDLVHYSGNIWRCLIDDTTGITPAEGVNWTLFIGEPTNLVERIIAPVETDPATNAWTVGRQIIYNDNLYEVIAAITAGDALVAYEDDPTNANIKLADPVETQLLNVKGNLFSRNLLDNPWFTVNQRGQNSFSFSNRNNYCLDRWISRLENSYLTITKKSNYGITLNYLNSVSWFALSQIMPEDVSTALLGKNIFLEILLGDITNANNVSSINIRLYDASSVTDNTTLIANTSIRLSKGVHGAALTLPNSLNSGHIRVDIYISTTGACTIDIDALKIEKGSVFTLAMDTAPNYAEELLKCQRYFISHLNAYGFVGFGYATSTTNIRIGVKTNTPMRSTPSISISDATKFLLFGNGQSLRPSAISVHANENDYIVLNVTTASAVASENYILKADNDVFSLSADL